MIYLSLSLICTEYRANPLGVFEGLEDARTLFVDLKSRFLSCGESYPLPIFSVHFQSDAFSTVRKTFTLNTLTLLLGPLLSPQF